MKSIDFVKRNGLAVLLLFLLQLEWICCYLQIINNNGPHIQYKIERTQKESALKLLQAVRSTKFSFFNREHMASRSRKTLIDSKRSNDQVETDFPSLSDMDQNELLRQLNATLSDTGYSDDSDDDDEIDEETIRKAEQIDLDNPCILVLRRRKSTNNKEITVI